MLGDLIEASARRSPGGWRAIWLAGASVRLALAYLPGRIPAPRPWRGVVDDGRSAVRGLRRDRGTVALAVGTLGLGMGAVTAILSALHGSLLKPLPFADPDRLVLVADRSVEMPRGQIAGNIALANLRDLARETTMLTSLAAYRDASITVSTPFAAERVRAQEIDAGFFETLGVPMRAGRTLVAADQQPDALAVVVIGESFWRARFGAERGALGRTLDVDGRPRTIVGIAGAVTQLGHPQIFVPLVPTARALGRTSRQVYGVGRLAPEVGLEAAQAELDARFADLRARHPEIGPQRAIGVMPLETWLIGPGARSLVWLLAGVVALVLVIACVNVTNLLLVRAERRLPDLRLRSALGATPARLIREMTFEALLLAAAGGAVGLVLAAWGIRVLVARYGDVLPRSWEIRLDPVVVAGVGTIVLVVTVAIVLLPALRLSSSRSMRLGAGDRGHSRATRAQRALIAAQTAIAMLLLAVAGLVVNTVVRLAAVDLGVRPQGVALFDVGFTGRYPDRAAAQAFVDTFLDRLGAAPGVTDVAAASRRPLFGGGNGGFEIVGRDLTIAGLEVRDVTPAYFAALGVPLASGRALSAADRLTGGVAVVNRTFERMLPDGASALGAHVQAQNDARPFRVVGVVADLREFGPTGDVRPTAYFPYGQGPYGVPSVLTFLVRSRAADPLTIVSHARRALADLDPHVAVENPATLAAQVRSRVGRSRLTAQALLSLAAVLALALTAIGAFGVMSQSVTRRTREIGIRRALGATAPAVTALVLRQGLRLSLPGLVIGGVAFLWGGQLVTPYLHGVAATDAATFALAASVLVIALVAACWLPARRAARVDPTEALRSEA
jgi:predicted permease